MKAISTVGCSAVCDCGISWSYSLTFWVFQLYIFSTFILQYMPNRIFNRYWLGESILNLRVVWRVSFNFIQLLKVHPVSKQNRTWSGSVLFAYVPKKEARLTWAKRFKIERSWTHTSQKIIMLVLKDEWLRRRRAFSIASIAQAHQAFAAPINKVWIYMNTQTKL